MKPIDLVYDYLSPHPKHHTITPYRQGKKLGVIDYSFLNGQFCFLSSAGGFVLLEEDLRVIEEAVVELEQKLLEWEKQRAELKKEQESLGMKLDPEKDAPSYNDRLVDEYNKECKDPRLLRYSDELQLDEQREDDLNTLFTDSYNYLKMCNDLEQKESSETDKEEVVAVGDLTSQEKGTTARKNSGKTQWHHVDLLNMHKCLLDSGSYSGTGASEVECRALGVLWALGKYQRTHDPFYLRDEIGMLYPYLIESTEVWTKGAEKYVTYNYMKGGQWTMALDSCCRHLLDGILLGGEEYDQETGNHHFAHAVCNLQMLLLWEDTYPEGNDLPPKEYFE